jgi:hypothetical protein
MQISPAPGAVRAKIAYLRNRKVVLDELIGSLERYAALEAGWPAAVSTPLEASWMRMAGSGPVSRRKCRQHPLRAR